MARSKGSRGRRGRAEGRKGSRAQEAPREREVVRIRWERRNVMILAAGLAAVALGYVFLAQNSITLAPILLVAGYCVLIPLAFIL